MSATLPLESYPDLAGRVDAFWRDGYVYLPGVLTASEVSALRDAMDRLEANAEAHDHYSTPEGLAVGIDYGREINWVDKSVNNAFAYDPFFLQYLDRDGVIDVEEAIHGEDCHVITMTAWVTGPGRPDQQLHSDWVPVPLPEDVMSDPRVQVPCFITTAHYYLDDLYEALGPTQFIPGSHRSGRAPNGDTTWQGVEAQNLLCKAGDVVIFRSEVWHKGTANTSDQTRYLLQVHYSNRWISQRYPPYLGKFQFDPDVLAQATPRQRRLMGEHKIGPYA